MAVPYSYNTRNLKALQTRDQAYEGDCTLTWWNDFHGNHSWTEPTCLYTLHIAMMLHYIAMLSPSPHHVAVFMPKFGYYALPLRSSSSCSSAAICSSILAPREGSLPCDLAMLVGCRRASSASSSCFFSIASTRSASAMLLARVRSSFESRRWCASGLPASKRSPVWGLPGG